MGVMPLVRHNVFCTGAFLAFSDFKLNGLAVGERGITAGFDLGMMNEEIC